MLLDLVDVTSINPDLDSKTGLQRLKNYTDLIFKNDNKIQWDTDDEDQKDAVMKVIDIMKAPVVKRTGRPRHDSVSAEERDERQDHIKELQKESLHRQLQELEEDDNPPDDPGKKPARRRKR